MTAYEELIDRASTEHLTVKEKYIPGYGGRIYGNRIAIHNGIETQTEKSCILAEELGHHYTTSGNILDQSKIENRKQELRAKLWAYNQKIGLAGLVNAFEHGCQNRYEVAEYLDVTEEFLQEAINCYREKYGLEVQIDNYVIFFEPSLIVMKRLELLSDD